MRSVWLRQHCRRTLPILVDFWGSGSRLPLGYAWCLKFERTATPSAKSGSSTRTAAACRGFRRRHSPAAGADSPACRAATSGRRSSCGIFATDQRGYSLKSGPRNQVLTIREVARIHRHRGTRLSASRAHGRPRRAHTRHTIRPLESHGLERERHRRRPVRPDAPGQRQIQRAPRSRGGTGDENRAWRPLVSGHSHAERHLRSAPRDSILRALSRGRMHGCPLSRTAAHSSQGMGHRGMGTTGLNRRARFYTLTRGGRKQLGTEMNEFRRMIQAIERVLTPEG